MVYGLISTVVGHLVLQEGEVAGGTPSKESCLWGRGKPYGDVESWLSSGCLLALEPSFFGFYRLCNVEVESILDRFRS